MRSVDVRRARKALRLYLQLLELEPEDNGHREKVGRLYLALDRRDEAIAELTLAARGYGREGAYLDAIRICKELLQLEPDRSELAVFLAQLYARAPRSAGPAGVAAVVASDDRPTPRSRYESPGSVGEDAPVVDADTLGVPIAFTTRDDDRVTGGRSTEEHVPEVVYFQPRGGVPPTEPGVAPTHPPTRALENLPDSGRQSIDELRRQIDELDIIDSLDIVPRAEPDRSFGLVMPTRPDGTPRIPLLSALPRAAFVDVLDRAERVHAAAGSEVFREGDEGEALYIVLSGQMVVHKRGEQGPIELVRLGPGAFFGEIEALSGRARRATVTALQDCQVFSIDRRTLLHLRRHYPGLDRILQTFYEQRLVSNFLATSTLFETLNLEERERLAGQFHAMTLDPQETLFEEGTSSDGLYLIARGRMSVTHRGAHLITVEEGDFLGVVSALTHRCVTATATARDAVQLLCLDQGELDRVLEDHSDIRQAFLDVAQMRELLCETLV